MGESQAKKERRVRATKKKNFKLINKPINAQTSGVKDCTVREQQWSHRIRNSRGKKKGSIQAVGLTTSSLISSIGTGSLDQQRDGLEESLAAYFVSCSLCQRSRSDKEAWADNTHSSEHGEELRKHWPLWLGYEHKAFYTQTRINTHWQALTHNSTTTTSNWTGNWNWHNTLQSNAMKHNTTEPNWTEHNKTVLVLFRAFLSGVLSYWTNSYFHWCHVLFSGL